MTVETILRQKGTDVVTIEPEASIRRAADWSRVKNIGALVVTRGKAVLGLTMRLLSRASNRQFSGVIFIDPGPRLGPGVLTVRLPQIPPPFDWTWPGPPFHRIRRRNRTTKPVAKIQRLSDAPHCVCRRRSCRQEDQSGLSPCGRQGAYCYFVPLDVRAIAARVLALAPLHP
jgi:hypothetical protein